MIKKIEEFLEEKPGYLKCSAERIQGAIEGSLDIYPSLAECQTALSNAKAKAKAPKLNDGMKVLIYDLETSYNIVKSWRVGYKITLPHYSVIKERAIICVSYKWLGEDEVYNISWDKDQDDRFLLEQFIEVLNEADLIVAHNGDNFDLKFVKTRALYHRLPMLPFYPQFDTLKTAKHYFMFNSNKLDYISQFLGYEGKIHTEPELWDRVILGQSKEALQEMIEYCNMDVIQLEKVYKELVTWDKPKQHVGQLVNEDKNSSPYSGSKNLELVKTRTTGAGTIKRIMKDLDTGSTFEMSNASYKKWLEGK